MATACAETSIKAEIDKATLASDETLTYKIIITSPEKKLPKPQLPTFAGFNILSQAQSTTMSFSKDNLKNILVYVFILAPTDIGRFKIESASLKIKDQAYATEGFEIEVIPGKQAPSLPGKSQPESEQPQFTL